MSHSLSTNYGSVESLNCFTPVRLKTASRAMKDTWCSSIVQGGGKRRGVSMGDVTGDCDLLFVFASRGQALPRTAISSGLNRRTRHRAV